MAGSITRLASRQLAKAFNSLRENVAECVALRRAMRFWNNRNLTAAFWVFR